MGAMNGCFVGAKNWATNFMATYMATYGNHGKLNPQKLNIYNTCNYVTTYVKRFHLEPELHFLQKGFFNGAKFGELKKPNEVRRLKKLGCLHPW